MAVPLARGHTPVPGYGSAVLGGTGAATGKGKTRPQLWQWGGRDCEQAVPCHVAGWVLRYLGGQARPMLRCVLLSWPRGPMRQQPCSGQQAGRAGCRACRHWLGGARGGMPKAKGHLGEEWGFSTVGEQLAPGLWSPGSLLQQSPCLSEPGEGKEAGLGPRVDLLPHSHQFAVLCAPELWGVDITQWFALPALPHVWLLPTAGPGLCPWASGALSNGGFLLAALTDSHSA